LPSDSRAADPNQNQFLNGGKLDQDVLERVQKLQPLAERNNVSLAQLALAWCLRKPIISSVIIGASRPSQVDDNAKSSGVNLGEDVLKEMDSILGF